MARPSSTSNASRLATSTTSIPDDAIYRANSLPIPDDTPVTSAQGPNRSLSRTAFIASCSLLFPFCRLHHCSIVRSHNGRWGRARVAPFDWCDERQRVAPRRALLSGKVITEHRATALGFGLRGFILNHVPMLD